MAIIVEVDWEKDGFQGFSWDAPYTDTYTDVEDGGALIGTDTDRVRPNAQAISVEYGRDQFTALSPTVAGRGAFTLDNRDRRYTPRNPLSPLYGYLKPARPVKITRIIGDSFSSEGYEGGYEDGYGDEQITFTIFNGHTDDSPINPDMESKTVALTLVDSMADMRGLNVNTGLHRDLRTGTAIGYILDACNWPADLRDIDAGATVIPWWWEDNTDALTALEKIVRSEGPPALLTVGEDGEIVFRDRHHRLTRTPSLTSQSTWQPTGTVEPVMTRGFSYDEAWRNIINTGTASVDAREVGAPAVVWTSDSTITLSAGQQTIVTAASSEPFLNAITPVAGTDFTLVSGSVTVRLIRTSGVSTGIELTASLAGPVVMTALRLRANPLTVTHTTQVSASDSDSVSEYGARSFPGDLPWCGEGDAQAVMNITVALRAQPLPVVSARFMIGQNTERGAAVLSRDLSDRVTIVEPETALAADFYVESIGHEITRHETDHTVTFGMEAVPAAYAADPGFSDIFTDVFEGVPTTLLLRFDTSGAGFDQGGFGGGLDLTATMFRFDTVGQGLDLAGFAI